MISQPVSFKPRFKQVSFLISKKAQALISHDYSDNQKKNTLPTSQHRYISSHLFGRSVSAFDVRGEKEEDDYCKT